MAADLGRLVATLEARAERFDLTLQRATQRLDGIASKTEQTNQRIARSTLSLDAIASRAARGFTVLGTALAAAGGALAYFASRQIQALDKLGDLSQQTGLTATSLRQLQVGLELNGGTAEQAGEGLLTFSRNLGQVEAGTGRLTGLLKKLDPAFLQTLKTAGSTDDALRLIADRIAVARSEQEKLAIATAAFGGAGRQFVLLLGEGARGVDALRERLESLGIKNLDEVTAAAQRFDDQMKLLKGVVTSQFTAGLFGVGDGLNRISDALTDDTVRNLGELANAMGRFGAALASVSLEALSALGEFFALQRGGAGVVESFGIAFQDAPQVAKQLEEINLQIEETKRHLRDLGAADIADAPGVAAPRIGPEFADIEQERQALLGLQQQRERTQAALQARQPFVGPVQPRPSLAGPDLSGLEGPGALGLDKEAEAARKKIEAERERILQGHEQFVGKMRAASFDSLTETQKLSLSLAETLGKIGEAAQAGSITAAEAIEFQTAAIEEATAAMEAADARAEALRQKAQSAVEIDLLRARVAVDEGSLFGASQALERELARAEAIVEASGLEQKIRDAYTGGDQAEMEARLAENARILQDKLDDINSNWDETLGSLADIGRETLDDFFRGIAEGSDASFEDMARSFALRLIEMEAAALSTDLIGALTGEVGGATSLTGQLLGSLTGGGDGQGEVEASAERAEEAAASASSAILDALASGSGLLVDAGSSIAQAIGGGASALIQAGIAAAAAIIEAAAAAAAASGISLFKEGGAVTSRGVVRLERIHALAEGAGARGTVRALTGEAGTERLLTLERVAEIAAASAGNPSRAASLAMRLGEKLDRPQIRSLSAGDIVIPDRKLPGFFDRVMPRVRLAEGGFRPLDAVSPLSESEEGAVGVEVNFNLTNTSGEPLQVKNQRTEQRGRQVDIFGELASLDWRQGGPGAREFERNYRIKAQPRET